MKIVLFSAIFFVSSLIVAQCPNFAITKAVDNGNGTYTICASSVDQTTVGDWTVINSNNTTTQSNTSSICVTGPVQGFTVIFNSNGVECSEAFEYPFQFDCDGGGNLLTVESEGECARGSITLNDMIDFSPTGKPYVLDFGDGSPLLINPSLGTIIHQYPLSGGSFSVCITFQPYAETYVTCCYSVYIPPSGCCFDPAFSLNKLESTESCVLPRYSISNNCTFGNLTQHIWEFEDGTVSYEETPPIHYFTDFVNPDNQVCVKHTMICCDVTVSYTGCASLAPGAYLGKVGEKRFMSDILNGWWGQPNSIQVKNFIQQYAQNSSVPLIIDGILVVDVFSQFNGGTWFMAGNTPEGVESLIEQRSIFSLTNVTIQSGSRIERSVCCIWSGIRSFGPSRTFMNGSTVNDAIVMLDYPSFTSIQRPFINIKNCYFNGNFWGIRSLGQPINFFSFYGNRFQGGDVCVCGCDVVNALDFRDMPTATITIKKEGTPNFITSYEQGIHADNVNLDIENFRIVDLQNFVPIFGQNPSEDDSRIGIDFKWTALANSSIKLDHVYFNDFDDNDALMRTGVKAYVQQGKCNISCNASTPFSSILMKRVETGYHLLTEPAGKISASIKENDLTTVGTNASYGMNIQLFSSDNKFDFIKNRILVSGGLNGGAGLNIGTPFQSSQYLSFLDNDVTVSTNGQSAGVNHQNIRNSVIKSNDVKLGGLSINGFDMLMGGKSDIICNTTDGAVYSILAQTSIDNRMVGNYLEDANANSIRGQGDCQGPNGSLIAFNTFDDDDDESVYIEGDCLFGPQMHNGYNQWIPVAADNGGYLELPTGIRIANTKFYSSSNTRPSITFPNSDPSTVVVNSGTIKSLDNICTESTGNDGPGNDDPGDNAADRYSLMVLDTSIQNNLTAAEYTAFQQGIFSQILDSLNWISTHANIDTFYTNNLNTFIGRSVIIQHGLRNLSNTITNQQSSLNSVRLTIDSLKLSIASINQTLDTAQNVILINQLESDVNTLDSIIQVLTTNLASSLATFETSNNATFSAINTANNNLTVVSTHEEWEQFCNSISLSTLTGGTIGSSDSLDLCSIAQTCYSDGGRAVYAARTLTASQLGVYFTDVNCVSAGGSPRIENGPTQDGVSVFPNPSSIGFNVALERDIQSTVFNMLLMDMTGKVLYSQSYTPNTQRQYTINTKSLASGSYILQITDEKGWKVNKLVFVKD